MKPYLSCFPPDTQITVYDIKGDVLFSCSASELYFGFLLKRFSCFNAQKHIIHLVQQLYSPSVSLRPLPLLNNQSALIGWLTHAWRVFSNQLFFAPFLVISAFSCCLSKLTTSCWFEVTCPSLCSWFWDYKTGSVTLCVSRPGDGVEAAGLVVPPTSLGS